MAVFIRINETHTSYINLWDTLLIRGDIRPLAQSGQPSTHNLQHLYTLLSYCVYIITVAPILDTETPGLSHPLLHAYLARGQNPRPYRYYVYERYNPNALTHLWSQQFDLSWIEATVPATQSENCKNWFEPIQVRFGCYVHLSI